MIVLLPVMVVAVSVAGVSGAAAGPRARVHARPAHRAPARSDRAPDRRRTASGPKAAARRAASPRERAAAAQAISKDECYLKIDRIAAYGYPRDEAASQTLWDYTGTLAHDTVVMVTLQRDHDRVGHLRRRTARLRREVRRFTNHVAQRTQTMETMKETVCTMTPTARAAAWRELRRESSKVRDLHRVMQDLDRRVDRAIEVAEHRR